MAYDAGSAYEPPRRPYLDRPPHPQAPVPSGHTRGHDPDYYASRSCDDDYHRDPGYPHAYQQPSHAYDRRGDRGADEAGGSRYQRGYDTLPQHDRRHQQSQERHYDPRYQPRAPRSPPPRQRGPAPMRPPQQNGGYRQQPRHNGHPPPQSAQQRDQYIPSEAPCSEPTPAPRATGKSSMEEWKAREKARMKAQAVSPETVPFDNAFPLFGDKYKKDGPDPKQSTGQVHRGSGEQRPMTAPGPRPGASRQHSDHNEAYPPQSHPPRPHVDRNQTTPEFPNRRANGAPQHHVRGGRSGDDQAPPEQVRRRPTGENVAAPVDQHYPGQWPLVAGTTPPKANHLPPQLPANHANGHVLARTPQYEQGYASEPLSKPLPKQRAPPAIDTSQQYQPPICDDRHPLSPANVPPRPYTSQGPRPPPGRGLTSPVSQRSYAADNCPDPPQKCWVQADHSGAGSAASAGDYLDDYGAEPAPAPGQLRRRPTTREEEIEAEMPDFDSAAPNQTSMLHKRIADGSTNQPPPPMANHVLPQSSSAPDVRYDQRQYQPAGRPAPTPGPVQGQMRGPSGRDVTNYGYGVPDPAPPIGHGPQARAHPPQHDPRYAQSPMQPPQAPFAHRPPIRRSLDDERPIPIRNGPPGQPPPGPRFYPNGQPRPNGPPNPNGPMHRGGYPPQRPEFDRMQTNQTTWSDPGQGRVGGAHPPCQGPMSPLNGSNGMPLTQHRSAPEQQPQSSNPDALPHHPVPVRPGLLAQNNAPPARPPPARNHNGSGPQHQRPVSADHFVRPVTHAELESLRAAVDANPGNSKQTLLYVKKLVEAASVLASEGGRADPKVTANNQEKYIMEAHKRLKRAVSAGYPEAQFYLADCYGQGMLGLEVDTKEAFKLYQAAAKSGHAQAAYRTAVCCEMGPEEGGGTSRDYAKAVQWYSRAAALGDGPAMYKIGAVLLKGLLGQQKNITEAVIWLKRGAERADVDNPHALHELATLYESTNTDPEIRNKIVADDEHARDLYTQAAQLGYKFSQFRLGQAYEYGNLGLQIDNRSSIVWYTKAAAQGEHQAELALSGWYLTGAEGILEQSDAEAYLWARKAASSEPPLAKAMFATGHFTENGIGCPLSMDEAKKWYGRAASYKFPKAIERLEELRRNGGKARAAPQNGKLTRKDQKHNEENCVVM